MEGTTISHYKVIVKVGEGGMGIVYKAEDTKLKRPVALKFLAPHLLQDEEARKRFHREAQAAAALHHPNVCTIHEIGEADGKTFLAMAFLEGESLDNKIEQGPLPLKVALEIARQIALGLEAAHEKGVVHRDIKPGNVMIDAKGQVTVMDFGLALLTEGSKLTKLDTTLGTVAYMSPEQAQGVEVDHRTDIWALGCVLYEMTCGQRPFRGVYDQALLYEIAHEEPEPLTGVRTAVPVELEWIVDKCLAKDRDERYHDAKDLILDLTNLNKKLTSGRSTILKGRAGLSGGGPGASSLQSAADAGRPPVAPAPAAAGQASAHPLVKYHVVEQLSGAGDSVIYEAEDTERKRSVSIRILPREAARKSESLERRYPLLRGGLAARGKSTTMHKVLGKENILVYNCFMAMGRRNQRQRQKGLWVAAADLPQTAAHPFYRRLNELLDEHGFDDFAEQRCEQFYAAHMGRPSLTPGSYFRCLLIGYLEGIDSERGIAWRLADSISLRRFLAIELDESTPDHSTISRTRRLIDVETHREVFTWVLQLLAKQGLLKGGTIAVDATTLEASAALRSIVRRDSGESYEEFLRGLAAESGIETPSREQLAKLDKKRKNKGSNKDWTNPHDPDAKIAKMKDGRTHLAHKAEHAVDLETGALLALTLQGADLGDTTTVSETISAAAQQVAAVAQDQEANEQLSPQGLQEVVADKGYHSNDVLTDLTALEMRSYINEPDRGRRNWCGKPRQQQAVYGNRRRMRGKRGKQLSRLRGERVERSFAHLYETGRMRRTHLRGHENILKRLLIHGGAFNLSLVLRKERGAGTPRGLAEAKKAFDWLLETVRRPFSAGRTLLLRLWPHPANTPFRLQSQSCVFGPARTA